MKRGAAAAGKSRKTKSTSLSTATPPSPFSHAPAKLLQFFDKLDHSKAYILHLDQQPVNVKKQVFYLAAALNIVIAALLIWRLLSVWTLYLDMIFLVLGFATNAEVDRTSKTQRELYGIVLWRAGNIALDYALVRYAVEWPVRFAIEGPCSWRWDVPFRDTEVVVRKSRDWGADEMLEALKSSEGENDLFARCVMPAIDKNTLRQKTGFVLQDMYWEVDFFAMIYATSLVEKKESTIKSPGDAATTEKLVYKDFEKAVVCYSEKHGGWMYWPVWKLDDPSAVEDEARTKIIEFKDKLTAMGHEDLFFRWVELIQYESNQPGEFTPERQASAVNKIKEMFQREGLDFEAFVKDIGGLDVMPRT